MSRLIIQSIINYKNHGAKIIMLASEIAKLTMT